MSTKQKSQVSLAQKKRARVKLSLDVSYKSDIELQQLCDVLSIVLSDALSENKGVVDEPGDVSVGFFEPIANGSSSS